MKRPDLARLATIVLGLGFLGLGALAWPSAAGAGTRTLFAGLDYDLIQQQSVPKYASVDTKAAAKVTCVSASAGQVQNNYAACYIFAPGFHRDLPAGSSIITSGGGTIRLGCDGYPYPIDCEAQIDDQDVRPTALR